MKKIKLILTFLMLFLIMSCDEKPPIATSEITLKQGNLINNQIF